MATVAYYTINGQTPTFFKAEHIDKSFVRTQPNEADSSFLLTSLDVKEVTNYRALTLKTINQNGDIEFSNSDKNYSFTLKGTWNDGKWMPIESCLALIRANSLNIQPKMLGPSRVQSKTDQT